jgi:hypothetical protein
MGKVKKVEEPIITEQKYSNEEILFALEALRASGMTQEIRTKVNDVYMYLFNEHIVYSCCKNRAYIKMDHYVRNVLKLI